MKKTKEQSAFERMTKPQQRVAIAIDAIKHIALGVYKPEIGTYFYSEGLPRLNQQSVARMKHCTVCQQGAILCSAIRLGNRMDLDNGDESEGIYPDEFFGGLKRWFRVEQLYLMEVAFERELQPQSYSRNLGKLPKYKLRFEAKEFGLKYEGYEYRMLMIMSNIIAHNGTFIP